MKNINAEIITIGDEILYGEITDTNSRFISSKLSETGINIIRQTSIGDNKKEILNALAEAENRADIIIITGGLGPTKDDITRKVLCQYFHSEFVFRQEVFDNIKKLYQHFNKKVMKINRDQACVPKACEVIMNKKGTAPGMWFKKKKKVFISMPGVSHEMKFMLTDAVIPKIKKCFKIPVIYHKNFKVIDVAESKLAKILQSWENRLPNHIKLAYLPHFRQIRLRLTARGTDLTVLKKEVAKEAKELNRLAKKYIYAHENIEIEEAIGKILFNKEQTIAIAESCTGGFVMNKITNISGCSAYFNGGIVCYNDEVKISQLGMNSDVLKKHGAVSEQTVIQMAENVKEKYKSDYGLAITGIAGPSGGTEVKPVGTIWIAVVTPNKTISKLLKLGSNRSANINFSFSAIMNLLRKNIS